MYMPFSKFDGDTALPTCGANFNGNDGMREVIYYGNSSPTTNTNKLTTATNILLPTYHSA